MSIRARLLVGVLVLTTIGLATVAVVSHTALRSYLSDRLNQQVGSAEEPASRALIGKLIKSGKLKSFAPLPKNAKSPPPRALRQNEATGLPPGTYGELRSRNGKVLARIRFSYGENGLAQVGLPSSIPLSSGSSTKIIHASARSGSDGFRVAAYPVPGGRGTVVVALPERDLNQTLAKLGTIELLASLAVLAALALLTLSVVKLGLAPLERMQRAASSIAAGTLNRRVEPAHDSTEVGRLGLALNEMLRRIQEAFAKREASEERMRRFLADASHELRTPLSSVRGYAELFRLGMTEEPGELAQAMRRIEAESERMSELVEDLLTLARLDQVRAPARDSVDLASLVGELVLDARLSAPKRAIGYRARGDAHVIGDAGQLRRVMSNLVSNAIRHTPEQTPIELSLEDHGDEVTFTVRDRGPGLAPGTEAEVFERFWRGDSARGRSDGGSGLGLAIVAAIVSAHGGYCSASSPEDGGALFTIALSKAPTEVGAAERVAVEDSQPSLSGP
jgi:two-component system OmpR family sensor kinase